jgi:hypothetical protein
MIRDQTVTCQLPFTNGTNATCADGLIDELHLFVYPLTRGPGPRLFPEEAAPGKAVAGGL